MEPSLASDNDPGNYPQNVASRTLAPYVLDTIRQQLHTQAPRLFSDEAGAAVDFLDFGNGAEGIWNVIPSRCSALIPC